MKHFLQLKYSFFLVALFCLTSFSSVLAQTSATTSTTAGCSSTEGGICIPSGTGLSERPIFIILQTFMFWLLTIVGMIAIIAFVISGMQYLTSVGDPKMAEKGKANMVNSIIGIVVALSGLVIIQAVSALFTTNTAAF